MWDALSDVMITFNADDLSETVAYIVENNLLISSVLKELKYVSNVTILNEAKVKNYHLSYEDGQKHKITMENGNEYTCNLLVCL